VGEVRGIEEVRGHGGSEECRRSERRQRNEGRGVIMCWLCIAYGEIALLFRCSPC
jgi:hypothetical protein